MKYIYYLSLIFVFAACQQEDILEASGETTNYFKAPDTATDEESVLRRSFEKATDCYVLFNDTLFKEQIGINSDGLPLFTYETIELGYGVLTSNKNKYNFTYLPSITEKKLAVEFIQEQILPVMEPKLYPYSFLLVDSIYQTTFRVEEGETTGLYGDRFFQTFYSGTRSFALSAGDILRMDEAKQKETVKDIFKKIIYNRLRASTNLLTDFYAYTSDYYGEELYFDYDIDPIEDVRELGFISGNIYYEEYVQCPSQSEDLEEFIEATFNDEKSFIDENTDYPIVIAKYKLLKNIIQELGYHTEKIN